MVRTTFDRSPAQKLFNYLNLSYLEHSHIQYGNILRGEDENGLYRYYSSYRQKSLLDGTYWWYRTSIHLSPSRKTVTVHTSLMYSSEIDPSQSAHIVVHHIDTTATHEGMLRIWDKITKFRAMMYHPLAK